VAFALQHLDRNKLRSVGPNQQRRIYGTGSTKWIVSMVIRTTVPLKDKSLRKLLCGGCAVFANHMTPRGIYKAFLSPEMIEI
jgi:hypothetical protein